MYKSTYRRNAFVVLCYLPTVSRRHRTHKKVPDHDGRSESSTLHHPCNYYQVFNTLAILLTINVTRLRDIWHLQSRNWQCYGDLMMGFYGKYKIHMTINLRDITLYVSEDNLPHLMHREIIPLMRQSTEMRRPFNASREQQCNNPLTKGLMIDLQMKIDKPRQCNNLPIEGRMLNDATINRQADPNNWLSFKSALHNSSIGQSINGIHVTINRTMKLSQPRHNNNTNQTQKRW